MVNELKLGTSRTGDFFDGHKDTPEVKAVLERSDAGISITLGWSSPDVPYAAWFMPGGSFLTDAAPTAQPTPAPKRVLFVDSHGPVLLIGCRPRGFHASVFGPGSGKLWARAAILGVGEDREFEQPHGLQSEISGLREWLGMSSWQEVWQQEGNEVREVLTSIASQTVSVGQEAGLSLEFHTGWSVTHEEGGNRLVLHNLLRCSTRSNVPVKWSEHMQLHTAIRDLLVISRWRSESCVPVLALRNDDPTTTLDGETHGDQWRRVVVASDERTAPPKSYLPHLLKYEDFGVEGILRWLRLRNEFARALDPVLSSINLTSASATVLLAQTGPGVEALGFLLLLRDGETASKANKSNLRMRLDRILLDVEACLPFNGSTWAEKTVETYNALKHANRALPDEIDVLNCWADTVMVVRAWVAVELGTSLDIVKSRLAEDRQPRAYVKAE